MKRFMFGSKKVLLHLHNICKYEDHTDDISEVEFDGVEGFDVISGDQGYKLGAEMEKHGIAADPYNEYLVLYFENEETRTYRNSFVDLFHI